MRNIVGPICDSQTYPIVIKACSKIGDLEEGKKIHKEAEESGFGRNPTVINALIGMYGKCGCFDIAKKLFDEMIERTVVSWSAMIGACEKNGRWEEGIKLFYRMSAEGVRPNRGSFVNVMNCYLSEEEADTVHQMVVDEGLSEEPLVQNLMVKMYVRCGRVETAREVFDKMTRKNLVVWNLLIEGFAISDSPMESLQMFVDMKTNGIRPDDATLYGIIHACSVMASSKLPRCVHGILLKEIGHQGIELQNALADLYVQCGMVRSAHRLFDNTFEKKNLESWNIMISGYGIHGMAKVALDLFEKMKEASIKPNDDTMLSVLSAYFHSGLVDEGRRFFNSMTEDFGISPKSKHYSCMVDLMGRGGYPREEILNFIQNMPIEPDSCVWESLLSSCRTRDDTDIEVAETAAKSLLEADSENQSGYVLLSNIYTYLGKQKESNHIRDLMVERGVKRTEGVSFVEVRNNVCRFSTGGSLLQSDESLSKVVQKLMESIRKEEEVEGAEGENGLKRNLLLHDIEEETNENLVHEHSEKLAVAFALVNSEHDSSDDLTILVRKNSRVCTDCHKFVKLASKIAERVIVLRDSNRFHRFKAGVCSCGN